MSIQKTFDVNYYYYHYCYFTFIHCCQKNDSHNLENKRLLNSLQRGVAYLYPLKTQKKSFRFSDVFNEYRQTGCIGLKSAKNEEKAYICVKA